MVSSSAPEYQVYRRPLSSGILPAAVEADQRDWVHLGRENEVQDAQRWYNVRSSRGLGVQPG